MAFWNKKNNDTSQQEEKPIHVGQISGRPMIRNQPQFTQITPNFLRELMSFRTVEHAVEFICDKTSDGKQALNVYLRHANSGIKVEWFNKLTNKPIKRKRINELFDNFCKKMLPDNSAGLDGLMDLLYWSGFMRGDMCLEVVISANGNDIEKFVLIDPITYYGKYDDKTRSWAIKQNQQGGLVDLRNGNIFRTPVSPSINSFKGTILFEAAILATRQYYALLNSFMQIIERIGFPRYKIVLDIEKFQAAYPTLSPSELSTKIKEEQVYLEAMFSSLSHDSDFVISSAVDVSVVSGNANGSGIDGRGIFEIPEPLLANGFQMPPILLSRLKGGSYGLGDVQYKVFTDSVDSARSVMKSFLEQVFNFCARVWGENAYCVVTHNPIDWVAEKDRIEVMLKQEQYYRQGEEYGWISSDYAAQKTFDVENADNDDSKGTYQYLKGTTATVEENTVNQEKDIQGGDTENEI